MNDNKHKALLGLLGVTLEDKELGGSYSINELAEKTELHHRTAKRWIENIYYVQNFVPRIDLVFGRNKRLYVTVQDVPTYVAECSRPDQLVILRLFNRKAYFGRKVPIHSLAIPDEETLDKLRRLIDFDSDYSHIGLNAEGVNEAWQHLESLSEIRDSAITDLEEGQKIVNKIRESAPQPIPQAEPEEKLPPRIRTGIENVILESTHRRLRIQKEIPSVSQELDEIKSALKRLEKKLEISREHKVYDLATMPM